MRTSPCPDSAASSRDCPRAEGQSVRSLVNGGNDLYKDQKYTDAEVNYRKALEKEQRTPGRPLQPGQCPVQTGEIRGGGERVRKRASSGPKTARVRADAYYNIGNALLKGQDYQSAIKAYIEALKLNPDDAEAKHNLSYALRMLQQQQQQQQQQNKNDKQQQDKKQDQQQQQQNQQQQNQQQKQQQQQQQQATAAGTAPGTADVQGRCRADP